MHQKALSPSQRCHKTKIYCTCSDRCTPTLYSSDRCTPTLYSSDRCTPILYSSDRCSPTLY